MPRPRKAIRPVEKTINLNEELCAKVDLLLWSELEEKVPHGAWSRYTQGLIEADLEARAATTARLAQIARRSNTFDPRGLGTA